MSDTLRYPSVPPKTLANDLSSTGTLIQLTECNDWGGVALTAASFNTTYIPGTLINDARTLAEFVLIDASTIANATTTGLLLYKRGLKYYAEGNATDLDEVTANKLPWTQGETKLLIGTNPPYMYAQFPAKGNDETITGLWTFPNDGNTPQLGSSYVAPTLDTQVATKGYVDAVAFAGAPDASTVAKGIIQIATPAERAAGTALGSTGAVLVPSNDALVKTSAGAGDENKLPVLDSAGRLDNTFMPTVYSRTADQTQITTDADSDNDAVRKIYFDTTLDARITQAEADTLTAGATSNASALHFHIPQTFATMSTPGGWYQPSTNKTSEKNQSVISPQDGSEMYFTARRNVNAASNNTVYAQRYLLNTSTGCFIPTDSAQLSINDTVTAAGVSQVVGSTYCWFLCCSSASANVVITRTTRALGSPQVMTISGSALAAAYAMCGDDNTLYVFTGSNPVVVTPYAISGTTATRGTSFNISVNSEIISPFFDGTDIIGFFPSLYQVRRYNLSGTIQGSSVTYGANTARFNIAGIAAKYGNTSQLYLTTFDMGAYDVTDATGNGRFVYNTISIPKP